MKAPSSLLTLAAPLALALCAPTAAAQGLLRDAFPGTGPNPTPLHLGRPLGSLGGVAILGARDDANGSRLWRSDGTDAGTFVIGEVAPLAAFEWNGALYFFAGAPFPQTTGALWRTDGTRQGTVRLRDGIQGITPTRAFEPGPGGLLYFFANDFDHGAELWRTDGTAAGTQMVVDLLPGPGYGVPAGSQGANGNEIEMRAAAGYLFFPGRDTSGGVVRTWRTDGTAAGTVQFTAGAGGGKAHSMEAIGAHMVYVAEQPGGAPVGLYRTDGTDPGTVLIQTGVSASHHAVVNGRYVYAVVNSVAGNELYMTDGFTFALVGDINPGISPSHPNSFTVVGNTLYLLATSAGLGTELWKTDGSPLSAQLVADLVPGSGSMQIGNMTAVGNELWFAANASGTGFEPWRSDGTAAGTVPVADLVPGATGSVPYAFTPVHGGAVFVATDTATDQPVFSDGTAAGTRFLRETLQNGSGADDFASSRGIAYFTADDGVAGREPWSSDGTAGGTQRLADTVAGPGGVADAAFVEFRDETWFVSGGALWRTRGTPATTALAIPGLGLLGELAVAGDALYLNAPGALLRSDGTAAGTTTVATVGTPSRLLPMGDQLVFAVAAPELLQVYRTDGTGAGTTSVFSLAGSSAQLLHMTGDDQHVWFSWYGLVQQSLFTFVQQGIAAVQATGSASTVLSSSTLGTQALVQFYGLTAFQGELWFVNAAGEEPWHTVGATTAVGFADLRPGAAGSKPLDLTAVGQLLYFTADDGVTGREVWRTDGTLPGTFALDVAPGAPSSNPRNLFAADDGETLVFANGDAAGSEVWASNGTLASTRRLVDANVGPASSDPVFGAVAGTTLVTSLDDGIHGVEPWGIPLRLAEAVLARPYGAPCGHPGGSRPRIGADGLPRLGNAGFGFTMQGAAPNVLCAVFVGIGRTEIPTPAGCTLQIDQVGLPFTFTNGLGDARVGVAIPSSTFFLGVELAAQFVAVDPPAGPAHFTLSDGMTALLGR